MTLTPQDREDIEAAVHRLSMNADDDEADRLRALLKRHEPRTLGLDIHDRCRVCRGPIVGRNRNATLCRDANCARIARAEKRAAARPVKP